MYRIILAEDEEEVRKLIRKHINESDTPFEVVGEAKDGLEAVALVRDLKPDILITDICMPNLNGLDMLSQIRESNVPVLTVVVSGYDEFSYAKQAMSMGVREYLLKPFLPSELFQVLNKLKEELEEKDSLLKNMQHMSLKLEQTMVHSREHFLRLLLNKDMDEEAVITNAEGVGFSLEKSLYCVGIIRFFEIDKKCQTEDLAKILQTYMEIIKDNYFTPDMELFEGGYENNQLVIVFSSHKKNMGIFLNEIQSGIKKIGISMEKYHRIHVRCTLGNQYKDYHQIPQSYKEALDTWKGVLNQNDTTILYKEGTKNGSENAFDEKKIKELEKQLLVHIQMNQEEAAMKTVEVILDEYTELPIEQIEYVSISLVRLVLNISDITVKAGGNIQAWEDETIIEFLKEHFNYGSLAEAKKALEKYIKKCCIQFAAINEKQGDRIVNSVKSIVSQNLSNEEFGLELLSEALHFSPNYIRQLFKAQTGESITDYLIRKRMEEAKKLLLNPIYKIQDVAEKTGYNNQRYFARCFKKYYNSTPTQYRENVLQTNAEG